MLSINTFCKKKVLNFRREPEAAAQRKLRSCGAYFNILLEPLNWYICLGVIELVGEK